MSARKIPMFQVLARKIEHLKRIEKGDHITALWSAEHYQSVLADCRAEIDRLESLLPSGSGIDCGTKIDRDASRADRIVLIVEFHCMDSNGGYCGWRDYRITITPSLAFQYEMRITGRDYNGLKEYLSDLYRDALDSHVSEYEESRQ